jgi:hypothetical protein
VRVGGVGGEGVDADAGAVEVVREVGEDLFAPRVTVKPSRPKRWAMDALSPGPAPRMSTRCGSIGVEVDMVMVMLLFCSHAPVWAVHI